VVSECTLLKRLRDGRIRVIWGLNAPKEKEKKDNVEYI
jgi:hypothetical protein